MDCVIVTTCCSTGGRRGELVWTSVPPPQIKPAWCSGGRAALNLTQCISKHDKHPLLSTSPRPPVTHTHFTTPQLQTDQCHRLKRVGSLLLRNKHIEIKKKTAFVGETIPRTSDKARPRQGSCVFVLVPFEVPFFNSPEDGQFGNPAVGVRQFAHRLGGPDHRNYSAPMEDVCVHRRQHHHGGGNVPGAVDVVRVSEHRTTTVQDLRLDPATGQ